MLSGRYTNKVNENDVFVFGANLAGRHGKGAALTARQEHGAVYGQGEGLQGNSYAIPTKGWKMEVLSLVEIEGYVQTFLNVARSMPERVFNVTRIGCGLAGYSDEQIMPMFINASENVVLPKAWGGKGFDR